MLILRLGNLSMFEFELERLTLLHSDGFDEVIDSSSLQAHGDGVIVVSGRHNDNRDTV